MTSLSNDAPMPRGLIERGDVMICIFEGAGVRGAPKGFNHPHKGCAYTVAGVRHHRGTTFVLFEELLAPQRVELSPGHWDEVTVSYDIQHFNLYGKADLAPLRRMLRTVEDSDAQRYRQQWAFWQQEAAHMLRTKPERYDRE